MVTILKEPKKAASLLSSKAGLVLWNSLGAETKKQLIVSSLAIITKAAAKKVARKTGIFLLLGVIIAGAILMVNNQNDKK